MLENPPLPLSPHFLPRPPASGVAGTSTSAKQAAQAAAARAQQQESEDADLFCTPAELVCPITHAVFTDPVLTAAGHVSVPTPPAPAPTRRAHLPALAAPAAQIYERAAIEQHLARSDTDPLTRQHLLNKCGRGAA